MPHSAYRLYVVGEQSPNPDDWSIWSEWSLVSAASPDEAREVAGKPGETVTEVPLTRPMVLAFMTEPPWGDDL